MNDTWALSFDSTTLTYAWTNVTPATNNPSNRHGACMAFDASSGQMVLFGGRNYNGNFFNDTWALSFDSTSQTYTWTDATPTNNPPARANYSMDFDASSGQVILFGGNDSNFNFLNDTWALSFDSTALTYTWAIVNPVTTPFNRNFASMAFDQSSGQSILLEGMMPVVITSMTHGL